MWRIDSPTSWDAAGARVQRVGFPSNSNICHFEWIQISNNLCLYSPSGNMWCQLCVQYFKGFIKSAGNTPCLQALNFMAKELRNQTLFFFFLPFSFSCQLAFKTTGSDFKKGLWVCCYVVNTHNRVYRWAFIPTHTVLHIHTHTLSSTFMQSDTNSIQIITVE